MTRSSELPQVPIGVFGRADANIANNNNYFNEYSSELSYQISTSKVLAATSNFWPMEKTGNLKWWQWEAEPKRIGFEGKTIYKYGLSHVYWRV